MSRFVIYNPDWDSYLFCGGTIHTINEKDVYVDDPNDATLFNTLDEIWEYLADFDYTVEPVIIKVELEVTPDHTIDHYHIKKETDAAIIEDALATSALTNRQKKAFQGYLDEMDKGKYPPSDMHRVVEEVVNMIEEGLIDDLTDEEKELKNRFAVQPQTQQSKITSGKKRIKYTKDKDPLEDPLKSQYI